MLTSQKEIAKEVHQNVFRKLIGKKDEIVQGCSLHFFEDLLIRKRFLALRGVTMSS